MEINFPIILPNLTIKIIITIFAIFLVVYPLINIEMDGELSFIMIIAGTILLIHVLTEENKKKDGKKSLLL